MGRKGEFREHKKSDQRIQKEISERHRKCSTTRPQRRNVPTGRTTRKVHGENVIWMVRQVIQPGILGEIRKELETMEGQETSKKRNDEDDPGRERNQRRKIGSSRIDRGR